MAKTVLRNVLIVAVLGVLFFFGFQWYEKQKKESVPPPAPQEQPVAIAPSVKSIQTTASASGALVQVSDVPSMNYAVKTLAEPAKGFTIEVPGAELKVAQSQIPAPHPLISSIDAAQAIEAGNPVTRIQVNLTEDVDIRDRRVGTTLYLELSPKQVAVEPSPVPTSEPVVKKAKKKIKKPIAKRPPKKRTPEPEFDEEPMDVPPPPLPAEPVVEAPPALEEAPEPAVVSTPEPQTASPKDEEIDLDALFGSAPEEAPPALPSQEGSEVAMLPPAPPAGAPQVELPSSLPQISRVAVTDEGGVTTVKIDRDPGVKYKIFRLINPNRVVVDFSNARNGLQSEYPAFSGTRVKRIATQQFSGPDGAITRVMLFVDGLPQYQKVVEGNSLILRLP